MNKREPALRFDGFSEPWQEKTLGEVVTIIGGGTPSTSTEEYWDGDINWFTPTEIGNSVYVNNSKKKISALGLKNSSAKLLPADKTILFTSRAGIGDMAILKSPATTNQGFQSLIVNDGYNVYFIYSYGFKIKQFALTVASGSTFLEVSKVQLAKMPILIPSLAEQEKIAGVLSAADERINLQSQKVATLKRHKQALMQQLFPSNGATSPTLRFDGFSEPWQEKTLGETGEIIAGGDVQKHRLVDRGNYPVLGNALINDGIMGYYNDAYRIEAPAVTVTARGNVGQAKARFVDFTPVGRLLVIKSSHNAYFLEQAINNYPIVVESSGIPQLTVPKLQTHKLFIPSLAEQEKIAGVLSAADNLISLHEQKLNQLKRHKQALMQQLFPH